jgi:membrane-bound lytic murein transglycosylase D
VKTPASATAPTIAQSAAPQAAPASTPNAGQAQASDAQQNAKIQQLILQAEASYNSGVENYRANRLDAARLDFDYAVDSMLSSGFDLTGDTPLANEFDRLVSAINSLEMAALKQGNGFSPKIEDAPLEAANDMTFAPNPELVAKLKNELNIASDLPLVINDQVAGYIGVFSNSTVFRNHMAASLERAGKYRAMMQQILAQEGVPQDLIYLSVAESGFQPQALNPHSGAGGMWQFMPTGAYGLARNGYFDERFDPEKSTRAYARYIKSLYNQFGDWYLAMAAYDWGPGNIQRVVQRTGYADFWELYRRNAMPAETRAYVPQILAAIIMAKNPTQYGLENITPDSPVLYDTVHIDYAIDLRLVADVTESTVQEIVALNPALLRLDTPSDMGYDLRIPTGTRDLFNDRLKDIPENRRASWRFHIVKAGDTIDSIAAALHAKPADIAETNGITTADPMAVGDELVVPVQSVASLGTPQRYTVHSGDSLVTIADRFNISLDELRRWNSLSSSEVKPGRSLYVAEPIRLAPSMRAGGRKGGRGRGRHHREASGSSSRKSKGHHTRSRGGKHKAAR